MSWTDKQSIRVIKYIKDKFKINTFVETGAFKGTNAKLHSQHFKTVLTCENNDTYYKIARNNLCKLKNAIIIKESSPFFLKRFNNDEMIIFYLDAHFYDSLARNKFIVLDELNSLKDRRNSILIIHDFDNNLGHITYDGQPLDFDFIKDKLLKVNKGFHFYTNTLRSCDIVKPTFNDIVAAGLDYTEDVIDNLVYAWSIPEKTFRGLLYCLPEALTKKELNILGLRKWK